MNEEMKEYKGRYVRHAVLIVMMVVLRNEKFTAFEQKLDLIKHGFAQYF